MLESINRVARVCSGKSKNLQNVPDLLKADKESVVNTDREYTRPYKIIAWAFTSSAWILKRNNQSPYHFV